MKVSKGLVDQHIHGAFGVNINTATADEIVYLAEKLLEYGTTMFFPTLYTDSIGNLKKQIKEIRRAKEIQPEKSSEIIGIHLEGPFINPEKKGIHNEKEILLPTIDNYRLLEDEIIKIVTLAPELDEGFELSKYLLSKGIKVSAGHTAADNLSNVSQVTHIFNAMDGINHRHNSTVTEALINDSIYVELIADSVHVNDEVMKLVFNTKPNDKIILISDSLPITHSNLEQIEFSSEMVYLREGRAINDSGTLAGSCTLLADIIKNLIVKNILTFEDATKMASDNLLHYHNLNNKFNIHWDENLNIIEVKKG